MSLRYHVPEEFSPAKFGAPDTSVDVYRTNEPTNRDGYLYHRKTSTGLHVRRFFGVKEDGSSMLDHWWWQYLMGDCFMITRFVERQQIMSRDKMKEVWHVPAWYWFWLLDACRGFGPPAFINNPWSGILLVIAVGVESIYILLFGLLGMFCAALTAYCLNVGAVRLHNGVAYFNGFLIGMFVGSTSLQRGDTKAVWFILPVAFYGCMSGFLKVALDAICHVFQIHTMNLPFSILALVHLGSQLAAPFAYFAGTGIAPVHNADFKSFEYSNDSSTYPLTANTEHATLDPEHVFDQSADTVFHGIFFALGKVYFCDNLSSVILCWIALFIASPLLSLMALAGSAVGSGTAMALGVSRSALFSGEYSMNSLLVSTSLGGFFYVLNGYSFVMCILGAAFSTCLSGLFNHVIGEMHMPFFGLPLFFTNTFFLLASAANDTSRRLHRIKAPSTHERNLVEYYSIIIMQNRIVNPAGPA